MWSGYVRNHLLPRIFGFELLMAPYAVAHFKLGMQLAGHDLTPAQREKWAYDFSGDERLGVFLTNTLEEAEQKSGNPLRPLARDYSRSKRGRQRSRGIADSRGHRQPALFGPLRESQLGNQEGQEGSNFHRPSDPGLLLVDGQPLGEKNPKWLQDDYVKFIRWGQWRIERTGAGILAFITNHGYLDNPTFRGMRQSLMNALH